MAALLEVLEKELTTTDIGITSANSGETMFYNTVRKMLPNASGEKFKGGLGLGQSIQVEHDWSPTNILNMSGTDQNVLVVVFVQDEMTKEVHQAAYKTVTYDLILGLEEQLKADGIALYPNPADQQLTLKLANKSSVEHTAFIFNNVGQRIEEVRINPGQDLIELNTSNYVPGIYLFTVPTETGAVVKRFVVKHR